MGIGAGLYMYNVVVKSSHSLSHLLMSYRFISPQHTIPLSLDRQLQWLCIHVKRDGFDQVGPKSQQGWPKPEQVGLSPPSPSHHLL